MQQSNNVTLSIIIISYNTKKLLKQCLESIVSNIALKRYSNIDKKRKKESKRLNGYKAKSLSYEIIVVDNNSKDGTKEWLSNIAVKRYSNIDKKRKKKSKRLKGYKAKPFSFKIIFNNQNLGFSKANNQGIKIAKGEYIILLNSDTIVQDNALGKMIKYMEKNPEVAAASPLLLNPDKTPQLEYFMHFPNLWQIFFYHNRFLRPFCKIIPILKNKIYIFPEKQPFETEQLPGAALMARKKTFNKVGLLDKDYPFFYEDVDWCYRAKILNQKLVMVPQAKIIHLKGGSWRKEKKQDVDFYRSVFCSLLLFVKKNYGSKKEKMFRKAIKLNFFLKGRRWR